MGIGIAFKVAQVILMCNIWEALAERDRSLWGLWKYWHSPSVRT